MLSNVIKSTWGVFGLLRWEVKISGAILWMDFHKNANCWVGMLHVLFKVKNKLKKKCDYFSTAAVFNESNWSTNSQKILSHVSFSFLGVISNIS